MSLKGLWKRRYRSVLCDDRCGTLTSFGFAPGPDCSGGSGVPSRGDAGPLRFAVEGAPPRFPESILYSAPVLPPADSMIPEIQTILETGLLNKGAWSARLEREFASAVETGEAVLFSSGGAALTALVRLLASGKKVLAPAFLFPPAALSIVDGGGSIRFQDVSPESWILEPDETESMGDPALVLGFHLFGRPGAPIEWEAWSKRHDVPVIFDAAHGPGSSVRQRPCGSFGVAEVFSLTPSKLVTAGEGGVVTTDDQDLARELRNFRNYGKGEDGRFGSHGMSARPTELAACLGCYSLTLLSEERDRRVRLALEYGAILQEAGGVEIPERPEDEVWNYHEYAIRIHPDEFGLTRDELAYLIEAEGVEVRRQYTEPACIAPSVIGVDGIKGQFPATECLSGELLQLPMAPGVTLQDARSIAQLISEAHSCSGRLKELCRGTGRC